MSDWIAEARAFYKARPWVTEMLREPESVSLPLGVLLRRYRFRKLVRSLHSKPSAEMRRQIIQHLAQAIVDGDISRTDAEAAIERMERAA